jgi:hypothetical protein
MRDESILLGSRRLTRALLLGGRQKSRSSLEWPRFTGFAFRWSGMNARRRGTDGLAVQLHRFGGSRRRYSSAPGDPRAGERGVGEVFGGFLGDAFASGLTFDPTAEASARHAIAGALFDPLRAAVDGAAAIRPSFAGSYASASTMRRGFIPRSRRTAIGRRRHLGDIHCTPYSNSQG